MKELLNVLKPAEDLEKRNDAAIKKALESLVKKDLKANQGIDKAVSVEFDTFKALILEAHNIKVFENAGLLKSLCNLVKTVFAEREDVATARVTVLNNVSKVAFGQVVGRKADKTQRTLKGFGFEKVVELMEKHPSIKAFKKAVADNTPANLEKSANGVERAPRQPSSGTSTRNSVNPADHKSGKAEIIKPEDAFKAAIEALKVASGFLLPGTHTKVLQHIHALEKELLELSNPVAAAMAQAEKYEKESKEAVNE